MKLKYFSEQTLPRTSVGGGRTDTPKITFAAAGMVTMNPVALKLIGAKPGDKLTIAQDEEEPDNFYLFKDPQHGYELRDQKKGAYAGFYHKGLYKVLQEAKDLPEGKSIKALIAGQPTVLKNDKAGTKYWGILIRPAH